METKFTKGKWKKISNDIFFGKEVISTAYHRNGYKRDMYGNYEKCEESEANALLISKAPLLFADLLDIVWLVERGATYEEVQERIKTSKQLLKEATEL